VVRTLEQLRARPPPTSEQPVVVLHRAVLIASWKADRAEAEEAAEADVQAMLSMPHVNGLELIKTPCSSEQLCAMLQHPRVKELQTLLLSDCEERHASLLAQLAQMPKLRAVSRCCWLDDIDQKYWTDLASLPELIAFGCPPCSPALRSFEQASCLRALAIMENNLPPGGVVNFAQPGFAQLTQVVFHDVPCEHADRYRDTQLDQLPQLEALVLSRVGFVADVLPLLHTLGRLQHLTIAAQHMFEAPSAEALAALLTALPQLRVTLLLFGHTATKAAYTPRQESYTAVLASLQQQACGKRLSVQRDARHRLDIHLRFNLNSARFELVVTHTPPPPSPWFQ
jgi:hypothetical protein